MRLQFLQRLPRNLSCIAIEFYDRQQADEFDIAQLEPILARFTKLECVTFCYHTFPPDFRRHPLEPDVVERIARALPSLHQRRVLNWDGNVVDCYPTRGQCTPLLVRSKSCTHHIYRDDHSSVRDRSAA